MLDKQKLLFDLSRFDGGAAVGGGDGGASGAPGGTQAAPSVAGKGNHPQGVRGIRNAAKPQTAAQSGGTTAHILYGRQSPQGERPIRNAAESQTDGQSAGDSHSVAGDGTDITKDTAEAKTPDERRKAYRDLMEGEYKDLYTEDTQHLINQRFKETEDLREQNAKSQSVLRILMGRYNIEDGDLGKLRKAIEEDDAYWAGAADEAGMSVEQYKQFQKLKRQNAELVELQRQRQGAERAERQTRQWVSEAEALKAKFPKFDLSTEVKNPQFLAMLKAGTPVEHAYKVLHFDELVGDAVSVTAARQEQKVVAQVRARGARPAENGTAAQSAFTVKDDVSKLSKKDRAEIARRAQRGEIISF